jgi:hypothetical protein
LVRSISSGALTTLATSYGTEPINIIEIQWNPGTIIQYADKDINIANGPQIDGKIIELTGLDNVIDILGGSTTGSISVTLDDTDDSIRQIFNTVDIHRKQCTVYQWFPNLAFSDRFIIFTGYIVSPIEWSEGERTLKFDILSGVFSRDVGFTPEQGQFFFVPIELIGNVWPLGFGSVVHQPAVKYGQVIRGATAQMFMLPDITLSLKQFLLQAGSNSLIQSYNFYNSILDQAQNVVGDPINQQDQYITYILQEDALKQKREDLTEVVENLNAQVKTLTDAYNEDPASGTTILTTLNTIKKERDYNINILKQYSSQLKDLDYNKKLSERNVKNAKYSFNVVGKLRRALAKIMQQYIAIQRQLAEIAVLMVDQSVLTSTSLQVTTGYRFPQGSEQLIEIQSQVFRGHFNGNTFTYDAVVPYYTNVFIGPKVDTDPGTFFIKDPNINLNGKYCLTNVGIIKVTAQSGLKCTFELKEVPQQLRTQQRQFQKNPQNLTMIKNQLAGMLVGDETDDDVMDLALTFPTDISTYAWGRLTNNGYDTQTIQMRNVTGGTFVLYYMDFATDPLPWNATSDQVYNSLRELLVNIFTENPIDLRDVDAPAGQDFVSGNLVVTGGPLPNAPINIQFKQRIQPMFNIRADGNGLTTTPVTQVIYENGNPTGGKFSLTCDISGQPMNPGFADQKTRDAFVHKLNVFLDNPPKVGFGVVLSAITNFMSANLNASLYFIQVPSNFEVAPNGWTFVTVQNVTDDNTQALIKVYIWLAPVQSPFGKVAHVLNTFNINYNDSAATVASKIANFTPYKASDLSCTGGPLNTNPVTITWKNLNPNISIYLTPNSSTLSGGTHPGVIVTDLISTGAALVGVFTQTVGAHEHTLNKIQKMYDSAIGKSQFGNALEQTKKNLVSLWNAVTLSTNADDNGLIDEIIKYQKAFSKINSMIQMPQSIITEANRLISDKEYQTMFDYEMLNYMQLIRDLTPIAAQVPIPNQNYYFTGSDIFIVQEVASTILPQWISPITNLIQTANNSPDPVQTANATYTALNLIQQLPDSQAFFAQVGSPVAQFGSFFENYVVNTLPSTIKAVYGHRNIGGVRYLVPLPTRYYTKNQANNFGLFTATTISLVRPLSYYVAESWEDDIYVTYTSSVGPNTADILQYIYQTYTTATIDSTSFAHVHSRLANYPSNFAISESKNALQAVEEIAWQARCATWIKDGVAFVQYLAETPTPVDTITESDVEEGTLIVTTGQTEDLVTKFTALWKPDYSLDQDFKLILRHNISLLMEIPYSYEFYTYNIFSLVQKSATFWLIRKSHAWKKIIFKTALHKLKLETYDYVTLNFANNLFCTGSVVALIEKAEYDSASRLITFTCWTPIPLGSMTPYTFFWPADLSATTVFPLVNEVISGNAGNPIGVKVPSGLAFDPSQLSNVNLRPIDFGSVFPSDAIDNLPDDPTNEFFEVDYQNYTPENFDVANLEDVSDPTLNDTSAPDEDQIAGGEESPENNELIASTGVTFGFVVGLNTTGTLVVNGDTSTTDLVDANKQYYDVRLMDGRTVKVQQIHMHPDDTIPNDTAVLVVWDKVKSEFYMNVPTWLGENNVG